MLSKRALYLTLKNSFFPAVENALLVLCTASSVKVLQIMITVINWNLKNNS